MKIENEECSAVRIVKRLKVRREHEELKLCSESEQRSLPNEE